MFLLRPLLLLCIIAGAIACTPGDLSAQPVPFWKFGNGAGLDFSSGSPVALPNSGFGTYEGTACATDANGLLLFYTNGNEVRDRFNNLMPNGTGLLGGTSSTECAIVPMPGDCNKFYIFHVGDHLSPSDLRYSIVDMCLNGGLGDVTAQKNIFLYQPSSEKIVAVKDAAGTGAWVITHDLSSNTFRVYPVTAAGVGAPVLSSIGSSYGANCMIGGAKISPNGQKLVTENTFCSVVDLFDFNTSTGVVSNYVNLLTALSLPGKFYGAEFSPNSQLLYLSSTTNMNELYQVDYTAMTRTLLASVFGNYNFGALQLGTDGKIYMARNNQTYLDAITNPNVPGVGCTYVNAAVNLAAGTMCELGLTAAMPDLNSNLPPLIVSLGNDTTLACNATLQLNPGNFCAATYSWQNGSTSPSFTVSNPGTYWVDVTAACGSGSDTIVISAQPSAVTVTATGPAQICPGQTATLFASGAQVYTWQPSATVISAAGDSAVVQPSSTTTYAVIGTTACAGDTALFTLAVVTPPSVQGFADTTVCPGATVTLSASGAGAYVWSGGVTSTSASVSVSPIATTAYYVQGILDGCTGDPDTVTVQVVPPVNGSVSGTSSVCTGESTTLTANGGTVYQWILGATGSASSVTVAPDSTTTYAVAIGDGTCPADTFYFTVATLQHAVAAFSLATEPCSREVKFYSQSQSAGNWLWSFGDGAQAADSVTAHSYTIGGTYVVSLIINPNSSCADTSETTIDLEASQVDEIWIPNAFTPNGDGKNETFHVYGPVACYYDKLQIFDRWGELIWETSAPLTDSWNGTFKNSPVEEGVYVWRLSGPANVRYGHVSVIR